MEFKLIIGLVIFVVSFYYIISEKIPVTWVSLIGGIFMVIFGVITEEQGIDAIANNLNIILLLVAMMIMVNLISETGFFQWIALKMAIYVEAKPVKLLAVFGIVTALLSAFLDNVTTVLLVIPVVIEITRELKLNPKPFILLVVISSNIGGAATLIGDPPNLIVATQGDLGFNQFFLYSTPLAIINMFLAIFIFKYIFKKDLVVSEELRSNMLKVDANSVVDDWVKLKKSLIIFILVIVSFFFESFHHRGLENLALLGALYLSIRMKRNPHDIFKEIEWEMIFFLIGLFLLVRGVEELKLLTLFEKYISLLARDNTSIVALLILWLSSFSTMFIGSISHAVTFSQVVNVLEIKYGTKMLWWALSYGTCYGGIGTLIASACNLIGVNVAKQRGCNISSKEYMKYGILIMILTGIVNSLFILIVL